MRQPEKPINDFYGNKKTNVIRKKEKKLERKKKERKKLFVKDFFLQIRNAEFSLNPIIC